MIVIPDVTAGVRAMGSRNDRQGDDVLRPWPE